MKKLVLGIIFLMFIISVYKVGQIRPLEEDTNPVFHVNVVNRGDEDFDDLSVRVFIPDFGIYTRTSRFDLNDGDVKAKMLEVMFPEDAAGYYPVRITISNDKYRKVKYSWIYIT